MNIHYKFQDLFIWQESKQLFIDLHTIFSSKEFTLNFYKDQLLRATLSISNNISEGVERVSNKESNVFYGYAKGSCGEVKNMIIIAHELNFINDKQVKSYNESLKKISSGLYNMIKANKSKQ